MESQKRGIDVPNSLFMVISNLLVSNFSYILKTNLGRMRPLVINWEKRGRSPHYERQTSSISQGTVSTGSMPQFNVVWTNFILDWTLTVVVRADYGIIYFPYHCQWTFSEVRNIFFKDIMLLVSFHLSSCKFVYLFSNFEREALIEGSGALFLALYIKLTARRKPIPYKF